VTSKKNIVIISLDEVRPDHLGCYGYDLAKTPAIDRIAGEGIRFSTCISASDFTPVALSSVISGLYPNKHGFRDAYSRFRATTLAEILMRHGYRTAAFVGNNLLSNEAGHSRGFQHWREATDDTAWDIAQYDERAPKVCIGYYWVDDFFLWLKRNYDVPFFLWGHLLETHEGSEGMLLSRHLISEGVMSEFGYYDAKIAMADQVLIGPLLHALSELGIAENTIVVVMSDHGTNLGEHSADPIPWRSSGKTYPQHTTLYDHDLRAVLIFRGPGIEGRGDEIRGLVRSIDIAPTLLDLVGIARPSEGHPFDGQSLLQTIQEGSVVGRTAYAEDLFEPRGRGALQAWRTERFKYIRNLTLGTEEYYDLGSDPAEQENIVSTIDEDSLRSVRSTLNRLLESAAEPEPNRHVRL